MKLRPVKWTERREYGRRDRYGQVAHVGSVSIGIVSWRTSHDQKDWQASSALTMQIHQADTVEAAKQWVEQEAERFVTLLAQGA